MKVKTQIKLLRNCNVSITNGFGNQLTEVKVDECGEIWAYENQTRYELHENDIIHHIAAYNDLVDNELTYYLVVRG